MSKRYPGGILRRTPQTPSQTSAQGIWDMASVTQAVRENNWPIAGVPDPLSRSLRFRASASAYLSRTNTNSPTNNKICTWSFWFKNSQQSANAWITGTGTAGTSTTEDSLVIISSTQTLYCELSGTANGSFQTTQVFRDPSAWYHIVVAYDTTQATNTNRIKLYVNGVQVTAFSSISYPALNATLNFGGTQPQSIGRRQFAASNYLDGYMTEVYFIDGQALTPSSFGTTDSQTGVWEPIAYTGTYGTNGFYLPFSNTASTATLGYDFSGNNNNWTTNNISLTSGITYDSMVDVPTLWIPYNTAGDTGALWRGNYAVLNPLIVGNVLSPTNGNLQVSFVGVNGYYSTVATIPITSGKWYWEATITSRDSGAGQWIQLGVVSSTTTYTNNAIGYSGNMSNAYAYYNDGSKAGNGTGTAGYGATFTTNDVIGVAFDDDAGTITFYKNGVSQGQAFSGISTTTTWLPIFQVYGSTGTANAGAFNFGQRPFAYTPPSGFRTLNTTNLPTPTIGATASTQANKYFDATLYTGNGSTQSITNSGSMQPDFLWIKRRDAAASHAWIDSVRGISNQLASNNALAEVTGCTDGITSLNSNGFSLGAGTIGYITNTNGASLVAWQWRASNATAVTNTAGSITSTVSANTTAGFSIVTYTGTGANATVGHGLGVAPSMVIVKQRGTTITDNGWRTYHVSVGATKYLILNGTDPAYTFGDWNNTAPTSTVFSVGSTSPQTTNGSGATYVAYCFAQIAGYSAFGSYTGNGSSDGPFVFTGFRPRFIMIKRTDSADDWEIRDTSLNPYNTTQNTLFANLSQAEVTLTDRDYDIVSNGFKLRGTDAENNGSGGTYIYMAFAESPFKFALAR